MKHAKRNSFTALKLVVLAICLAAVSGRAASAPTNSWSEWKYKYILCVFTNSLLVSLNGHTLPAFATNMFDDETHLYMYSDVDGDVFGTGDISLKTGDRAAVFNVEAKGSVTTKGSTPNVAFSLTGEGSGTVGTVPGTAHLDAKFVQTKFVIVEPGGVLPETYYAEGKISGTVKQSGGKTLKFEDTMRILLDNVPGHAGDVDVLPQLKLDLVDIDGQRFAGHTHGTNTCFGKYRGDPVDELIASGSYKEKSASFTMDVRGLGHASDAIKCTVTGQLDSAPSGSPIHVSNMTLKGKAYGQKPSWKGNGIAYQGEP